MSFSSNWAGPEDATFAADIAQGFPNPALTRLWLAGMAWTSQMPPFGSMPNPEPAPDVTPPVRPEPTEYEDLAAQSGRPELSGPPVVHPPAI
jgi:hypothetical protein